MKAGRGLLALIGVLAAGALGAPLAHAGSYDVLSCSIDGGFYPNNAWVASNTVRFRGSLRGRPLPPRGVTLEFQAHQPGRGWRTVKTTRTRKGGVYSTRYRFNSASGRFSFRLRLRPNDSYPYARGTSKAVRVRVG